MYSEKVLDHFHNPRNVGYLEDADGVAQIGDPECGDYLLVFLRICEDRITEARFLCRGCPAAIACASVTMELVTGRHVDEAWDITDEVIVDALDGLPEGKLHCSNLGAMALHVALLDYFERKNRPEEHAGGEEAQAGGRSQSDTA
jgi:nitrogen fixation NifU-like protein